jgi:hypothetical protein
MEILPIPFYFKKQREIRFHETFFESVSIWADSASLIAPAYEIGCRYGLAAMDALHIAAAQHYEAESSPPKNLRNPFTGHTKIYRVFISPWLIALPRTSVIKSKYTS